MSTNASQAQSALTDAQSHALLEYVTMTLTASEIQALKYPGCVSASGYPFSPSGAEPSSPTKQAPTGTKSSLPFINSSVQGFVLSIPGISQAPLSLFRVTLQALMERIAGANLSDSFDRGIISKRKTFGYFMVVMCSHIVRGLLGGYPRYQSIGTSRQDQKQKIEEEQYDVKSPVEAQAAFQRLLSTWIYPTDPVDVTVAALVGHAKRTDKLEELPAVYQAAHAHALTTFASVLHEYLVASDQSQALLNLIIKAKDQLPWFMVRQSLKVANAATMLNLAMKLLSFRSPSWTGRKNESILQSIVSVVLSEDRKRMQGLLDDDQTKSHVNVTPEQIRALDKYVNDIDRTEQGSLRNHCIKESISLVQALCAHLGVAPPTDEETHHQLLNMLTLKLAIRDRTELIDAMCKQEPDYLSSGLQGTITIYDTLLREVHNNANISQALGHLQTFLEDLLNAAQANASKADIAAVCQTHSPALHTFLHQCCQSSILEQEFTKWYEHCFRLYGSNPRSNAAGAVTQDFNEVFAMLSEHQKSTIRTELDEHAAYLARFDASPAEIEAGWMNDWRSLIAATPVTANGLNQAPRKGVTTSDADPQTQEAHASVTPVIQRPVLSCTNAWIQTSAFHKLMKSLCERALNKSERAVLADA